MNGHIFWKNGDTDDLGRELRKETSDSRERLRKRQSKRFPIFGFKVLIFWYNLILIDDVASILST